jgi:3-oxoacyl-[acyl-carrier protein] reductase
MKEQRVMEATATLHPHLTEAFSLRGRTAVVTGAAGGIGRQAAITFAQAGADIVVTDRAEANLDDTVAALEGLGVTVTAIRADVASKEAIDDLARRTLEERGRVDVWANVAGILHYTPIVEMQEVDLRRVIDVNLLAGDMASPSASGYGLTKAAVMQFTRTLAMELGPDGIRANAVAPGWIETPMTTAKIETDDDRDKLVKQRARISPMGLTGVAEDISLAMLYLAADASRFVTGQVLRPNGGIVMP